MEDEEIEIPYLSVGLLKEMLNGVPDDTEVFIRCCHNPCGNITIAGIADKSAYGFFGKEIPCIIIQPHEESHIIKRK